MPKRDDAPRLSSLLPLSPELGVPIAPLAGAALYASGPGADLSLRLGSGRVAYSVNEPHEI